MSEKIDLSKIQIDKSGFNAGGMESAGDVSSPQPQQTDNQEVVVEQNEVVNDNEVTENLEQGTEVESADTVVTEEINAGASDAVEETNTLELDTQSQEERTPITPTEGNNSEDDLDDFIKGVIDYYKKTGDLTAYLEAKTVDYDKMSDREIFAKSLKSDYPTLSDKAFDKLLERTIESKFGDISDEDLEDGETPLGLELLKAEADKLRSQYKQDQDSFKAPEVETTEEQEIDMELIRAENIKSLKANADMRKFMEGDTINVKNGGADYNFEVKDKQEVFDMTADINKFMQLFGTNDEANPIDFNKWLLVASFAQDPDNFIRGLVTSSKSVGVSNVLDEIRNPSNPTPSSKTSASKGDLRTQMLSEALKQKKR